MLLTASLDLPTFIIFETLYAHTPRMGDLHPIGEPKPRKLREVEWTEGGLRLSPVRRTLDSGWFWPILVTVHPALFLPVLFW
jgi:hypothetical protein